jgi:hypothetical protein
VLYEPLLTYYNPKCQHPVSSATTVTPKLQIGISDAFLLFMEGNKRGRRWHSLLRHYATSRKVAGSIPDEVIEFFQFT